MRPRSIYQLITDRFALPNGTTSSCGTAPSGLYCGGTYTGIISELDYIQGMGFDTIWISPVVENIGGMTQYGEAYHGYWTLNPDNLNDHFGTADELKSLSKALHDRGMYLMVDIVINHVAATSSSGFVPNPAYGPFSKHSDYHSFCWVKDYNNQTNVEDCWLGDSEVALPDLNTESQHVIDYWYDWVPKLVSNYSIDALRIDTVKHVDMAFWPGFTQAAGVYSVGEVWNGDAKYVGAYQKEGKVNPLNYPIYDPLVKAFQGSDGSMDDLVSGIAQVKDNFVDPTLSGVFLNNQDNPRFESYTQDTSLRKNAEAYALIGDGIPIVYYGSEAGFNGGNDPDNREPFWPAGYKTDTDMYGFFKSLNAARSAAGAASSSFYTTQMSVSALSDNEILIVKGSLVSVLSNRGSSGSTALVLPSKSTSFPPSAHVVDAVSCDSMTTDQDGDLNLPITNGLPRVLLLAEHQGPKVCPGGTNELSTLESKSILNRNLPGHLPILNFLSLGIIGFILTFW
ncbi:glycoside hydrolase superfamily [Kockovaella imperatae]|uniref:alpha-amylase n=1 Tax=Kockovaella imperatae TaxID=4999 RepID=A0A1Y1UKL4_9TREE|nr:glycoside hydrolase superfamily [Kockovaella imperatae]ORX38512.1 glycoside hydrolase superfamily [Kockovaella imperatae]